MPKVLAINSFAQTGCVAGIMKAIEGGVAYHGFETVVAYARGKAPSYTASYRIGRLADVYAHALKSRLFDAQGLGSKRATSKLIRYMDEYAPDIVHLHQLHGSYIHYPTLFEWLAQSGVNVIWTLHDEWPFSGGCACPDLVGCRKWETRCFDCPQSRAYPQSWFLDRSSSNFDRKKLHFTSIDKERLVIVAPSRWLSFEVGKSFLSKYKCRVINNGVALNDCLELKRRGDKVSLLSVASKLSYEKGLAELRDLSRLLDYTNYSLTLVGEIDERQKEGFDKEVRFTGLVRNRDELSRIYAASDMFLNFTHADNFPTVNIEALYSGLPILTFGIGGSAEVIDEGTGWIVKDVGEAAEVISRFVPSEKIRAKCRARGSLFTPERCGEAYASLYEELVS